MKTYVKFFSTLRLAQDHWMKIRWTVPGVIFKIIRGPNDDWAVVDAATAYEIQS